MIYLFNYTVGIPKCSSHVAEYLTPWYNVAYYAILLLQVALGLIMAYATHIIFPPHRICKLSNTIPEGREPLATGYNHEDHLTS